VGADLTAGAIALLVSADRMASSAARVVSATTSLVPIAARPGLAPDGFPVGHLALAPLEADDLPSRVESESALLGTFARACVELCPI
jgi:hypothetical protein